MAQYKLIYFNLRGRAEVARFLFAAAGQQFEDFRFERSDWPKYKADTPFGQTPVLEVTEGGKTVKLGQSIAIARYLGRKFDMYGKTDLDKAEIDMYADQLTDMITSTATAAFESDETKKKQAMEKANKETLPDNFKIFDAQLSRNPSGFFAGNSLSWLDLYFVAMIEFLAVFYGETIKVLNEKYPKIKEHDARVRAVPKIAEWLAKRPENPM